MSNSEAVTTENKDNSRRHTILAVGIILTSLISIDFLNHDSTPVKSETSNSKVQVNKKADKFADRFASGLLVLANVNAPADLWSDSKNTYYTSEFNARNQIVEISIGGTKEHGNEYNMKNINSVSLNVTNTSADQQYYNVYSFSMFKESANSGWYVDAYYFKQPDAGTPSGNQLSTYYGYGTVEPIIKSREFKELTPKDLKELGTDAEYVVYDLLGDISIPYISKGNVPEPPTLSQYSPYE